MKKNRSLLICMIALIAIGLIGYASLGFGAPHTSPITIKDVNGATVSGSTPYSPKQTCGTAACHNYESDVALATKDHGVGTTAYNVPYPQHGVTAGYHFQQGRNMTHGNAQRDFYHVADFTSSAGMYGKY